MKIPKNVAKMIDEGWCFDCNGHLQLCIRSGDCLGREDCREIYKEVFNDAEKPIQLLPR